MLAQMRLIYTEVLTQPGTYTEMELDESLALMRLAGFDPWNVFNLSVTPVGVLRQMDAIFLRSERSCCIVGRILGALPAMGGGTSAPECIRRVGLGGRRRQGGGDLSDAFDILGEAQRNEATHGRSDRTVSRSSLRSVRVGAGHELPAARRARLWCAGCTRFSVRVSSPAYSRMEGQGCWHTARGIPLKPTAGSRERQADC